MGCGPVPPGPVPPPAGPSTRRAVTRAQPDLDIHPQVDTGPADVDADVDSDGDADAGAGVGGTLALARSGAGSGVGAGGYQAPRLVLATADTCGGEHLVELLDCRQGRAGGGRHEDPQALDGVGRRGLGRRAHGERTEVVEVEGRDGGRRRKHRLPHGRVGLELAVGGTRRASSVGPPTNSALNRTLVRRVAGQFAELGELAQDVDRERPPSPGGRPAPAGARRARRTGAGARPRGRGSCGRCSGEDRPDHFLGCHVSALRLEGAGVGLPVVLGHDLGEGGVGPGAELPADLEACPRRVPTIRRRMGSVLLQFERQLRSALIISVMVTPSFSSTSTTSPRATSRLLM